MPCVLCLKHLLLATHITLGVPSYKDPIVHIYYLAARKKPLFYPEGESNSYAFIL
jgi:hypothetical protein